MFVFFTSRKTVFKSWLGTSSIASYLSSFLKLFLIAISPTPRYLVDRSSFCSKNWCVDPRYLLNTSAVDEYFQDTSSTDPSIPVDTFICRELLAFLYKAPARSGSHFHRSLSQYFSVSLPKTLQSHSYLGSQGFSKVFQVFLHLVSF